MGVFFLLSSLLRPSAVSVVFDFNASLNDFAPVSPMLLSVDANRKGKSELLMDVFCIFLLSSQPRLSSVSVVFDFSVSLNDVVPIYPILLSVHMNEKEKSEMLMYVFGVFFFVFTPQIEFSECCV